MKAGRRARGVAVWAAVALVLAACVTDPSKTLRPGQSADDVVRVMGPPTARHPLPEGALRLEYASGPYGLQTWMIDLDADGRVLRVRQVLDEPTFAQLRPGDSRDDVLRQVGRPGWAHGAHGGRTLWYWRYDNPLCRVFVVTLEPDGRVRDAGSGTDPACEGEEFELLRRR